MQRAIKMNLGRCHQILNDHRRNQLLRISSGRSSSSRSSSRLARTFHIRIERMLVFRFICTARKVYAHECVVHVVDEMMRREREINSSRHTHFQHRKNESKIFAWKMKCETNFVCLLSISFWFSIWPKRKEKMCFVRIVDAILALPFAQCLVRLYHLGACVSVILWWSPTRLDFFLQLLLLLLWYANGCERTPHTNAENQNNKSYFFFFYICLFVSSSLLAACFYFTQLYLFIFYNHRECSREAAERKRDLIAIATRPTGTRGYVLCVPVCEIQKPIQEPLADGMEREATYQPNYDKAAPRHRPRWKQEVLADVFWPFFGWRERRS